RELALIRAASRCARCAAARGERERVGELHACGKPEGQAGRERIAAAVGVDRGCRERGGLEADRLAPSLRERAAVLAFGEHLPLRLAARTLRGRALVRVIGAQ